MNLLSAQDTKLKVNSLNEDYLVKIEDHLRGAKKKVSIKSKLITRYQLLTLIDIAGENSFRVQSCTDNSGLFEVLIY